MRGTCVARGAKVCGLNWAETRRVVRYRHESGRNVDNDRPSRSVDDFVGRWPEPLDVIVCVLDGAGDFARQQQHLLERLRDGISQWLHHQVLLLLARSGFRSCRCRCNAFTNQHNDILYK